MKPRRAQPSDVPGMLALKKQLRFSSAVGPPTRRGGFLLGSTAEGYRQRLQEGRVWVLEGTPLGGFAVGLPDAAFKSSELWQRREQLAGTVDVDAFADQTLGYFDQLAVRPGAPRRYAAVLALAALLDLWRTGADAVVATTVVEPVENRAAVPLLERLGGVRLGRVDEHAPGLGPLVSEVWLVTRASCADWLAGATDGAAAWIRTRATAALEAP